MWLYVVCCAAITNLGVYLTLSFNEIQDGTILGAAMLLSFLSIVLSIVAITKVEKENKPILFICLAINIVLAFLLYFAYWFSGYGAY